MTKKEIAKDFLTRCAVGDSREAFKRYVATEFKHHNVYFKGDANTLMVAIEDAAKANPNKIFQIQRALEDGDEVAVHSKVQQTKNSADIAVMHIFKFDQHNKIIELWDFGQVAPENMPNENGMF